MYLSIVRKQYHLTYRTFTAHTGSIPYDNEEDFQEKVNYLKKLFKTEQFEVINEFILSCDKVAGLEFVDSF